MGTVDFAIGKATKYFNIASNRLNMGMDFRKIVKMRVGGRTGMFILQLMENYTKLGDFGGEAEQAALGGTPCSVSRSTHCDHQELGCLPPWFHHTKAQFLILLHCA